MRTTSRVIKIEVAIKKLSLEAFRIIYLRKKMYKKVGTSILAYNLKLTIYITIEKDSINLSHCIFLEIV